MEDFLLQEIRYLPCALLNPQSTQFVHAANCMTRKLMP